MNEDGVLVGCNKKQEWLLKWWWLNYKAHNDYPVTFVDFGMSQKAKKWCAQRGSLKRLDISNHFITPKNQIDPNLVKQWQQIYAKTFWPSRVGWFKKPLAMLLTSYERTLWTDLDCEIRGSLEPLFSYCENAAGMGVCAEMERVQHFEREKGLLLPGEVSYNGGVIIFQKDSVVIKHWAEKCMTDNAQFIGDQHILSRILFAEKMNHGLLPALYNWTMSCGKENPDALIVHWSGPQGKREITRQMLLVSQLLPLE